MQTFLPYSDFYKVSKCLDQRRLGKQRIETKQILQTLLGISTGWANHPAVKMWRGHEFRLCVYGLYMSSEWKFRGFEDNQFPLFSAWRLDLLHSDANLSNPPWMGDERLHESHRRKLVWKDPEHYCDIFGKPDEPFGEPEYYWPV